MDIAIKAYLDWLKLEINSVKNSIGNIPTKTSDLTNDSGFASFPVGSIYISTDSNEIQATNFRFGTWIRVATGQVLLGVDVVRGTSGDGSSKQSIEVVHEIRLRAEDNDSGFSILPVMYSFKRSG
jgi:hypothetical protein